MEFNAGRLPVRGCWGAAPGARRRRSLGLLPAERGEAGRADRRPKARELQAFELNESTALAVELGPVYGPLVVFAAETGLRPAEWIALERRDMTEAPPCLGRADVRRRPTASPTGRPQVEAAGPAPTAGLSLALVKSRPRLDTPLLFPVRGRLPRTPGLPLPRSDPRWKRQGSPKRGPYALRHTFITHALSAGVPIFDVARYAGTSVQMIERTYGHLAKGSERHARELLAAYATDRLGQERATTTDEP